MEKKRSLFAMLSLLMIAQTTFAQLTEIIPKNPIEGENITIRYHPAFAKATFSIHDRVYAVIHIHFQNGSNKTEWRELKKTNSLFETEIKIVENSAHYNFHFITFSKQAWDRSAETETMVYRTDGIPVKNAYHAGMDFDNFEECTKKELELYPDNYGVYRNKWFFTFFAYRDSAKTIIERELQSLLKKDEKNPGLLHSMSYGYLLLKDELKARELVLTLITDFPHHPYTLSTINSYEYQVYSQNYQGEGKNIIRKSTEECLAKNISNPEVWPLIRSYSHFYNQSLVSDICTNWIEQEPDNPQPYYILGNLLLESKNSNSEAEYYVEKCIELILHGRSRLYLDISGKMDAMFLSRNYFNLYKINIAGADFVAALGALKAAQSLLSTNDVKYYEAEGKFWGNLGNSGLAETAFVKAYEKGSQIAEQKLQDIFISTNTSDLRFSDYLKKISGSASTGSKMVESNNIKSKQTNKKKETIAPEFSVISLKGEKLNLKKLKGKVVVLNFWFTGCGPCKAEIPLLNEIAKKYKKVVFIAFALDEKKNLTLFLKETPFHYHIVANALEIVKTYNIKLFPSHVIIDKNGLIRFTSTGSGESIAEQLSIVIDRLL